MQLSNSTGLPMPWLRSEITQLQPTLEAVINKSKQMYEVHKDVRLMEMTYEKFIQKWTPYNHLVT